MFLIRIQYDAYNRQFKLLDREMARMLEDGATYLILADVATGEVLPADIELPSEFDLVPA